MDDATALDLGRATLLTALMLVAPPLLVGLFVGLVVSLFQTVTALQEQTLALVPKMIAVIATLLILMPWFLRTLMTFTRTLMESLPQYVAWPT